MSRAPFSVRQRITAAVALLSLLSLVLVGATLFVVESRRTGDEVAASMRQEVDEFRTFQRTETDPTTGRPFASADRLLEAFLRRNLPDANELIFAFPTAGEPLYQGEDEDDVRRAPAFLATVERLRAEGGTATFDAAGRAYRVSVVPVQTSSGDAAFVVLHDTSASREPLRDLMVTYALLAALSVLAIAGIASWVAGRLLRPVTRLRETAQGITAGDLSARLQVTGRDDLSELQRTVNDMLDRLESAFTTQRQLLDDAGHELRTPLTVLRGHLEVLDPDDPDDVRHTRALLLDEVDRMARLVGDLLVLAKARRPDFVTLSATDVGDLTDGVLHRVRAMAERDWVLDEIAETTLPLDGQRITQALLQLADNAVKHTGTGDRIGIGSRVAGPSLELWVRDTGPGVDPALREEVFDRFMRAGAADDEGFGLGLSIVRAIARAHGGDVALDAPAPSGGATFRLVLPMTRGER